jgi:hypothetical protein
MCALFFEANRVAPISVSYVLSCLPMITMILAMHARHVVTCSYCVSYKAAINSSHAYDACVVDVAETTARRYKMMDRPATTTTTIFLATDHSYRLRTPQRQRKGTPTRTER